MYCDLYGSSTQLPSEAFHDDVAVCITASGAIVGEEFGASGDLYSPKLSPADNEAIIAVGIVSFKKDFPGDDVFSFILAICSTTRPMLSGVPRT